MSLGGLFEGLFGLRVGFIGHNQVRFRCKSRRAKSQWAWIVSYGTSQCHSIAVEFAV